MSDVKSAKDAVIASLIELSAAAKHISVAATGLSKNMLDFYGAAGAAGADSDDDSDADVALAGANDMIVSAKSVAAAAAAIADGVKDSKDLKKKKKDPNAPKKPLTTYILFSNEVRDQLREENPDLAQTDLAKKIATLWHDLSEEKKKRYQEIYDADKLRYLDEMDKFTRARENGLEYIAQSVKDFNAANKIKKEAHKQAAAARRSKDTAEAEGEAESAAAPSSSAPVHTAPSSDEDEVEVPEPAPKKHKKEKKEKKDKKEKKKKSSSSH